MLNSVRVRGTTSIMGGNDPLPMFDAQVKGNGTITYDIAQMALKALNIDQYGLDRSADLRRTAVCSKSL